MTFIQHATPAAAKDAGAEGSAPAADHIFDIVVPCVTSPHTVIDRGQTSHILDDVTVVIVSFFSGHCFEALSRSLGHAPHIVVVDNSASDDEAAVIRRWIPHARVLTPGRNLGFGAANNLGFEAAETTYVALVNPDCPATMGDIATLTEFLERTPSCCAAAPQLVNRSGQLDVSYRPARTEWDSHAPAASGPTCVGYVSGAMMVIRRAALKQIGGFDERFFLYYEDDDLCLRLTANCGPIVVLPDVQVTHLSRQSSRTRWSLKPEFLRGFHHVQSKFTFQLKHSKRTIGHLTSLRYAVTGGLEAIARLILLDLRRSSRAFGRCMGAIRYRKSSGSSRTQ